MNSWDRQRDEDGELEPGLWWHRFDAVYRPMGPERSLLGAANLQRAQRGAKRRSSVPGAWDRAFAKWHWKKRAEAWDEEQRLIRIAAEEQARAEMLKRHLQIAVGLQQVGDKRLKQLDKTPEELAPAEVRRYLGDGVALEREARGMPNLAAGGSDVTVVLRVKGFDDV